MYVFTRNGDVWTQTARLQGSDTQTGDHFGQHVAVQGDTIVVGAPYHIVGADRQAGAVYTLDRTGTPNRADGETIVVGAHRDSFPGRNYVGSAYTFESTGDHSPTSKLVTSDGKSEDRVGWGVAVGGAQIAVAADLDDHGTSTTSNEGSVYLYPRSSPLGERFEASRLTAPEPARADYFGSSVDMDGTTLIVGASSDDVGANDEQGSATISFAPATAPACSDGGDNDGDGKTDFPNDPGCESPDDTSEADPPPSTTPQPGPTATPGGSPPGVLPAAVDDGSKAPRIIRPRTQPPVTPTKERTIKFATVWDCVDQPGDAPCKAYGWVTIAYIADDARALKSKKKRLQIGSSRVTIPSGAKKPVTVKLTKKAYKLLRRRGKLKARVEMQLSRPGTGTARTSFPVTIKAPKARKK